MTFYSPLRYPGGKNKLAGLISQICESNQVEGHYIEPYAGGASIALFLLIEGKINEITINDFDRSIYAFWYSVLHHTNQLCKMIEETPVTVDEWLKQREIQRKKNSASLLRLGFSTLFLNRTNRSGILNAGPIGGIAQKSDYKIDCRFNKPVIIERIKRIAALKKHINLHNMDAIKLIRMVSEQIKGPNTIMYFDPPYYLKGPSLYMNHYSREDHEAVAREIRKIKNIHWIISYDDTEEINEIYRWVNAKARFSLVHSASKPKAGQEVLFFSNQLVISKLEIASKY